MKEFMHNTEQGREVDCVNTCRMHSMTCIGQELNSENKSESVIPHLKVFTRLNALNLCLEAPSP
jgi:hypothetical protein